MKKRITGVLLNGATPAGGRARRKHIAQRIDLPEGEPLELEVELVGEDDEPVPYADFAASALTVRTSLTASGAPLLSRGGDAHETEENVGVFLVGGTEISKGGRVYDVVLIDGDDEEHHVTLAADDLVVGDAVRVPGDDVTPPGAAMMLIGLPVITAADIGKVLVPTDDDPRTFAWTSSPFETVTGAAAIDAGALIKLSSAAGQYETLAAADDAGLMIGVAKTACSGAAATFQAYFISGIVAGMLSDGTGTIAIGASVEPSTTVAGRVKSGSANSIGRNVGALVAATLDAAVSVR